MREGPRIRRRAAGSLLLAGLCVASPALPGRPAAAADTGEGKSTAHVSAKGIALAGGSGDATLVAEARLRRGKKSRVLVAEASVVAEDFEGGVATAAGVDLVFNVFANGALMEGSIRHSCGASAEPKTACSAAGVFWLDLSAAEEAAPGTFHKQPLVVTLEGAAVELGTAAAPTGDATLVVRMEKR